MYDPWHIAASILFCCGPLWLCSSRSRPGNETAAVFWSMCISSHPQRAIKLPQPQKCYFLLVFPNISPRLVPLQLRTITTVEKNHSSHQRRLGNDWAYRASATQGQRTYLNSSECSYLIVGASHINCFTCCFMTEQESRLYREKSCL